MKNIKEIIAEFCDLSEESEKKLFSILTTKKFKRGDVIAAKGEIPVHFFVLKSGVARSFFSNETEKQYTRTLYFPVSTIGAFSALVLNKPSQLTYDCLTDCEVYYGDFSELKKLIKLHNDIAVLYSKILEFVYLRMEKRIYELSALDSKERYKSLKKKVPMIENLIPQYQIASYLNITPVQLSRIRKEYYSQ